MTKEQKKKYLQRIKVKGSSHNDGPFLRLLHRQHLLNIPFENLDIHYGKKIILTHENALHKITEEKRGGFCYEVNGAFYLLLLALGYNAKMISGAVCGDPKIN